MRGDGGHDPITPNGARQGRDFRTMSNFWRRQHWRSLQATWQTFGLSRELVTAALRDPALRAGTRLSLGLDNVFFPSWREAVVKEPVFLVGHPRSGTTMLHRCLTQADDFVVFEFWQLLFPALTARKVVGPLVRTRIAQGKDVLMPKEVGHGASLAEVDEEELLFVIHALTQFYPVLSGLAFSDEDFDEIVFSDDLPEPIRRASMAYLDGCLRRQMLFTGRDRVVAKMNYSGMRIHTLLEAFPDCRIVYLVRSPLETIPSHLSLHRNVLAHRHGLSRIPPAKLDRYLRRRYEHNVDFYRIVEQTLASGEVPDSQVLTVSYDDLMNDLDGVVSRVADFADLKLSDQLQQQVAMQAVDQRSYRRPHENLRLEDFGITRAELLRDLDFVFERYGFDTGEDLA